MRLDMSFIPDPTGIHGNLLQNANHRVVLLVVLGQSLIRVLAEGYQLFKPP